MEVLRFSDMLLKFIMVVDYWELLHENYMAALTIWTIDSKFSPGVHHMLGGRDANKTLTLLVDVGTLELSLMKSVGDP